MQTPTPVYSTAESDQASISSSPPPTPALDLNLNHSPSIESFLTASGNESTSTQSLFVPGRKKRSATHSTDGIPWSNSAVKLELDGLISILDEDEQAFQDYQAEYYLHSLAATGNLNGLGKALVKVKSTKELEKRDKDGRTLLHCAASFHSDTRDCIQLILFTYRNLVISHTEDKSQWNTIYADFVNLKDNWSQTALYLAAKYENVKVVKELIGNNADWDVKTRRGKTPILKMFKKTPHLIKKTLLKFATQGTSYKNKEQNILKMDFGPIIGYPNSDESDQNPNWIYEETHLLSNICHTKQKDRKFIIDHILVKIFIWIKWKKFKYFFWLIVVLPILRLLLYFWFLIRVYRKDCPYPTEEFIEFSWVKLRPESSDTNGTEIDQDGYRLCYSNSTVTSLAWVILIVSVVDLLLFETYPTVIAFRRHWYPMKTKTLWKYTKRTYQFIKILSVPQYVEFAAIFLNTMPALGLPIFDPGTEWQYVIASVGVFFAWFHIFHQFGKVPPLKVYVTMFRTVLVTLFDVSFMYGAVIFAFAMVFCILLPGVGSYSSLSQALLKIPTFLIGEIEYEDIFYAENSSQISASLGTTKVFYVLAILVLHVALLNFLVGLTVADIQRVHDDRKIIQDCCKIWQISLIETFLSCAPKSWGLPLLKYLRVQTGRNICDEDGFVVQLHINEIPKPFRKRLRELLANKKAKEEQKAREHMPNNYASTRGSSKNTAG